MSDNTTIQVSKEFRDKLWKLSGPGKSYQEALEEHLPDDVLDDPESTIEN